MRQGHGEEPGKHLLRDQVMCPSKEGVGGVPSVFSSSPRASSDLPPKLTAGTAAQA